MSVTSVLAVVIVNIAAGYPLHSLTDFLVTFLHQQMEMITHQTISIEDTVTAARIPFVIIAKPHPVKGVDKLPAVFLILKDSLMVNTTHHDVEYPCTRFLPCLTWHIFDILFMLPTLAVWIYFCEIKGGATDLSPLAL